jgi:predicted peptidase
MLAILLSFLALKNKGFNSSVYITSRDVERLSNWTFFNSAWVRTVGAQLPVDRVYLEVYRAGHTVNATVLRNVSDSFGLIGVETAGAISLTSPSNLSFCYADTAHKATIRAVTELAAAQFDSLLVTDFYSNCKSDAEITAKGTRTWLEYRKAALTEVGQNIVGYARARNSKISVQIKYPLFNRVSLEGSATPFDGISFGNDEAVPHLPEYSVYNTARYFDRLATKFGKKNFGGFVRFANDFSASTYADEVLAVLLAKAPAVGIFDFRTLLTVNLSHPGYLDPEVRRPIANAAGEWTLPSTIARSAGRVLELDDLVFKLGNPIGVKLYKPVTADPGDEYLEDYLGSIGIPIDIVPDYPTGAKAVIVTAAAASDPKLIDNIKETLRHGGDVVVTTTLVSAVPNKIAEIVELRADRDLVVNNYVGNASSPNTVVRQLWFQTNDAWALGSAGHPLSGGTYGTPLVLRGLYSNGSLYTFSVPNKVDELLRFPSIILDSIRSATSKGSPFTFSGAARVSFFLYDNDYLVVKNFNDAVASASVYPHGTGLFEDVVSGEQQQWLVLTLQPREVRFFRLRASVPFNIVNQVFGYGQDTTTVLVDASPLTFRAGNLDPASFVVTARATVLLNGTKVTAFSGFRDVLSAYVAASDELALSGDGRATVRPVATGSGRYVVLTLRTGMVAGQWGTWSGVPGAGTLVYINETNVPLNLSYHVKQVAPIAAANGTAVTLGSHITKSRVVHTGEVFAGEVGPLVRNFTAGRYSPASPHDASDYLEYHTYVPTLATGEKVPLVLWLHGIGEGRIAGGGVQDQNVLRANREAVAWITPDAIAARKAIVLVPQSPNRGWWVRAAATADRGYNDALTHTRAVVDRLLADNTHIDHDRVYIAGDSLGGFGVFNALRNYPGVFAAAVVAPGGFNVEGQPALDADRTPVLNQTAVALVGKVPTWLLNTGVDFAITNRTYYDLKGAAANVRWTHYKNATNSSAATYGQEHWVWIPTLDNRPATNDQDIVESNPADTPGQHILDWLFVQKRK